MQKASAPPTPFIKILLLGQLLCRSALNKCLPPISTVLFPIVSPQMDSASRLSSHTPWRWFGNYEPDSLHQGITCASSFLVLALDNLLCLFLTAFEGNKSSWVMGS
ncbi:hypothetical protein HDV62DRAFT_85322 [Trichoderma sp. SZMC 28011]